MDNTYDIAVIGGGPAGMMAAGRAAELGARVVLLEKNARLGEKLLITGGGRCNICNAEFDTRALTEKYGKKGKCLFSVFSRFGVRDTIEFFESRGLRVMIEAEKRAFPMTEKAADVHALLRKYMAKGGVEILNDSPVLGLESSHKMITKIVHDSGSLEARKVILATGGKSHPETGSTGDGFRWLRDLGHTVIEPDPALVPITIRNPWTLDLAGVSLKGVRLTASSDGEKFDARSGKMLFTHTGLSGPLVLNMSKGIGAKLKDGDVTLALDLYPGLDAVALDRKVQEVLEGQKNRMVKNSIGAIVQPRLGNILLALAGINGDTPIHQLTREERLEFVRLLKRLEMKVSGLLGEEDAVVTGGGVALDEVDFRSMRSKLVKNLFLVGDILDFDRPSGGFSLQICWSTGWIAGGAAAQVSGD